MKSFLFISILVISISSFADTGIFYSEGGNLFPIQETSISMQKEILHFTYTPEGIKVDVFFEFYNPGETRTEIVGFVIPKSMSYTEDDYNSDIEKTKRHPFVYDFMTAQNGKILPYEVTRYESRGFNTDIDGVRDLDIIYYFNVTFEPGVTNLYNHYVFKGGVLSNGNENFIYKLKTGKMWANQTIGDFTMIIDAEKKWIEIPTTLSKSIASMDYEINGIGKTGNHPRIESRKYAYLLSGFLNLHVTNLKPDFDIYLTVNGLASYYYDFSETYCKENTDLLPSLHWVIGSEEVSVYENQFEGIEDIAIQDMINFLYAIHGYNFNGNDVADYFTQFTWYIPDPQLNAKDIKFTLEEQVFLTALVTERTKRRE